MSYYCSIKLVVEEMLL